MLLEPVSIKTGLPRPRWSCETIEAQYRKTGPAPTQSHMSTTTSPTGKRPLRLTTWSSTTPSATYDACTGLIKGEAEPTRFRSWHYTVRSADGHVAQHVATHNVAAHAGNWYLNMHSVGVEHEGFAAGQAPGTPSRCTAPPRAR